MKSTILMPVLGLLTLIVTFRWWFRALMAPKTLGRWLLATLYLVFVGALWFLGIAFDMGKPPSVAGLAFIFAALIGLWLFTGLPMAIFGAFDSIDSHRVRRSYAQKHGLIYQENWVKKNLIPKTNRFFRNNMTNVLWISEDAYIATTLRYMSDDEDSSFFRGSEFISVEKFPVNGTVVAVHDPAEKLNSSKPEVLEFEGTVFRIDSAKNIQVAGRTIENEAHWIAAARKILQSVLQTIADPSPEILKRLVVIYFFDGRAELDLDLLDTESKLDEWVRCVKRLAGWTPPPHLLDEILS
ncbi:MAG: hypothetical protein WBG37_08390 [Desulfobacterales bacterium]